jgi:hypothetical protein
MSKELDNLVRIGKLKQEPPSRSRIAVTVHKTSGELNALAPQLQPFFI